MKYDVIVIGAGIGGLAAALELSAKGKKVLVLERQPIPGGLATSFTRKGFTFESALHCADGLGPEGEVREFLDKYGISQRLEFIPLADFMRLIYPQHDFVIDFKRAGLVDYLKNNFPRDCRKIDGFFSHCDKFYRQFERFAASSLPQGLSFLLSPILYPRLVWDSFISAEQLLGRFFQDKQLIGLLSDLWKFIGSPPNRLSAVYFLIVLECYYLKNTSYVRGGFSKLFQAMVEKIRENGSEVKFDLSVKKIRQGFSVITDQQEVFQARAIISNANPIETLTKLYDDSVLNQKYSLKFSGWEKSLSCVQVYLGLSESARNLGMNHFMFSISDTYDQEKNFRYYSSGDYEHCSLNLVDHAQIDPGMAPTGKGVLLIMCGDSFANWSGLHPEDYKDKKAAVAAKLIARAERYLPGLSGRIEVMEVATPLTVERFGNAPQGAIYGFAQTVKQAGVNRLAAKTEIKGLYLSGAWVFPGAGFHACFISGELAAEAALEFLKARQ